MGPGPQIAPPWTLRPDGFALSVRLTPKSSRDSLEGVEVRGDGKAVFKARVRAVPEDGKANAALCRLLAEALGIAAGKVTVESGATGRIKVLRIAAEAPAELVARLEALSGLP